MRYSPATIIETPRCFHGYQRLVPFRFEVSVRFQRSGTNTSLVSCARQSSRARPTRCTWLPWRKVPMGEKPNKLLDVSSFLFFFSTEELGFWMDFRWVSLFEQQMSRRVGLDMGVSPANNRIYLSMYIYIYTHRN